jgi:hypothetical protein
MSLGARRLRSVNSESLRIRCRRQTINSLSLPAPELTFLPYAEVDCTQQNAQISGKALQDYRRR